MGEMIPKPDANPMLLAILNVAICGIPVGYFMMGQSRKAIAALVYTWVLGMFSFGMGGFVIIWVWAWDAYLLGSRLAAGDTLGEHENGLGFLDVLPGFKP